MYLVLDAVSCEHVLDVVQEVADGVHVRQVLAVVIHSLQHLIERYSDLRTQGGMNKGYVRDTDLSVRA